MKALFHACLWTVCFLVGGCCSPNFSNSKAALPFNDAYHGTFLFHAKNGRLLQKTVWHEGKLISAWQHQQREDLPLEVIQAVHQGKRDWPTQRWVQTVKKGNGRIYKLDEDGKVWGWEEYWDGKFYRGAH